MKCTANLQLTNFYKCRQWIR